MLKSQEYLTLFQKSLKLKDWLSYFSALSWEKYTKFKNYPTIINVGEVCINELLVETMLDTMLEYPLPIRFFHSTNETANGNDFEIIMPIDENQYVLFPCQAKRIFPSSNAYNSVSHPVRNKTTNIEEEQVNFLLRYGQRLKGFPIYFFYNYTPDDFKPYDNYSKELFGCTILNAFYVKQKFIKENKKLKRFSFSDIHPPAKPMVTLADLYKTDFINNGQLLDFYGEIADEIDIDIHFYTLDELLDKVIHPKKWIEMHPEKGRSVIAMPLKQSISARKADKYEFKPKYKILFTPSSINNYQRINSFK